MRARACDDVGVPYTLEAQLDAPLGDRELVDGACEMTEYSRYLDCQTRRPTH